LVIDPCAMHETEVQIVEPPHIEPADLGADAATGRHDLERSARRVCQT
jgi:hypothetical protein